MYLKQNFVLLAMHPCIILSIKPTWCILVSHPHRVTSTKCLIDTVISPDDGHVVARNMYRKEINILRKIVHKVGLIYKIYRQTFCNVDLTELVLDLIWSRDDSSVETFFIGGS